MSVKAKPFLKWAGGKAQVLPEIRKLYPPGAVLKYAEPFVGGGAVFFDIAGSRVLSHVYLSDINRELVATYLCVRDHVGELIYELACLEREYLSVHADSRRLRSINSHGAARGKISELLIKGA